MKKILYSILLALFVLLLQVHALYDKCQDARQITLSDLDENGVATFEGDTTDQEPFCWVCISRLSCPQNYTRNYFYKFQLKNKRQLELSTCNTKTNFNTRVAVLTTCQETRAHTCLTSNDDDSETADCSGGKSQVIFTAEANTEYYVVISGSTASDVGHFQMTIKEFKNNYAPTCLESVEIKSFPATIPSICGYSSNNSIATRSLFAVSNVLSAIIYERLFCVITSTKPSKRSLAVLTSRGPRICAICLQPLSINNFVAA